MSRNKKLLMAFVLVALVQLFVPAKMIFDKESVLTNGVEFKFKTIPIDPSDPFRGKYITLDFTNNKMKVSAKEHWKSGEPVYAILTINRDGFATIESVSKSEPSNEENYLLSKIVYVEYEVSNGKNELIIEYPFDRYYMEESKAYDAELSYRDSQRDSTKTTYALVSVKNGDAVLKDVLIDGISIKTIVKERQKREQ